MNSSKPDYRPDLIEYKRSNSILISVLIILSFVSLIAAYWFLNKTTLENRSESHNPASTTQVASNDLPVTQPRISNPTRPSQRNNVSNSIMYRCVTSSGVVFLQDNPCPQESISTQQIRSSVPRNSGIKPDNRLVTSMTQEAARLPHIAIIRNMDAEIASCRRRYTPQIERLERERTSLRNQNVNREIDRLVRERQICIDRVKGVQTASY